MGFEPTSTILETVILTFKLYSQPLRKGIEPSSEWLTATRSTVEPTEPISCPMPDTGIEPVYPV